MGFRRRPPKDKIRKTRTTRTELPNGVVVRTAQGCVALLSLCVVISAGGQSIQVAPGDCRSGVQVVARDARLVDVLKRMAETLGFELRYEGDEGRVISVNATREPAALISSLSPADSIVVTQAKDPKCAGRNRVVKVWVLPTQTKTRERGEVTAAPAAAPAKPPARAVVREQVMRGSPELEEQSRRAKAAYDEYVRIHGVPPPGVPEEIGKP
jgi:hypothetical protein